MNRILQFVFRPNVPMRDVEETLHLAMFAVEGLTGRVRVRLDTYYLVDQLTRSVFIYEGNLVGWLVSRIFAALVTREFGDSAVQVTIHRDIQPPSTARKAEEVAA